MNPRLEPTPPKHHEDHIAENGFNSISHCNLGAQVYSYAASNENSRCETSSGQRMGEARQVARVAIVDQNEQHKGVIWKDRKRKEQSTFVP